MSETQLYWMAFIAGQSVLFGGLAAALVLSDRAAVLMVLVAMALCYVAQTAAALATSHDGHNQGILWFGIAAWAATAIVYVLALARLWAP